MVLCRLLRNRTASSAGFGVKSRRLSAVTEATRIEIGVIFLTACTIDERLLGRPEASIRRRNGWDDPEADKADKEDERALLPAFVVIIAIWAAAFVSGKRYRALRTPSVHFDAFLVC
jgi:hypothetical protein